MRCEVDLEGGPGRLRASNRFGSAEVVYLLAGQLFDLPPPLMDPISDHCFWIAPKIGCCMFKVTMLTDDRCRTELRKSFVVLFLVTFTKTIIKITLSMWLDPLVRGGWVENYCDCLCVCRHNSDI